ncbi:plasmid mobilization relaxosome protein MobC [Cellulosimicrobium sp. PMB13]
MSNNVNQMAKATNATGEVQDEMVETLRAVRRLAERSTRRSTG